MKTYTFEVTKKIVVTVEASNPEAARVKAEYEATSDDCGSSFYCAEPVFELIGTEPP